MGALLCSAEITIHEELKHTILDALLQRLCACAVVKFDCTVAYEVILELQFIDLDFGPLALCG